jgi:RHS repeat-associated protein
MLAAWQGHFSAGVSSPVPGTCTSEPYGQTTVPMPAGFHAPVNVTIDGYVADDFRVDGQIVGASSLCSGPHSIDRFSFTLSTDSFEISGGRNKSLLASYSVTITISTIDGPLPAPDEGWTTQRLFDPGNTGVPDDGGCAITDGSNSMGVNLATGSLSHRDGATLASAAAGIGNDQMLEWTTNSAALGAQSFGNGWNTGQTPQLHPLVWTGGTPTTIALPFSGSDVRVFKLADTGGSTYTPAFGSGSTDTLERIGGQFVFRTASGDSMTFGAITPARSPGSGQFLSRTDANGNSLTATLDGSGAISRLTTTAAGRVSERQVFNTIPAGSPNAGKVRQVDVWRADGSPTGVLVRSTRFFYYDTGSPFGAAGDLATVSVLDAGGVVLDTKSYRYTLGSASGQSPSMLQYVFDTESTRRLAAAGIDLASAPAALVAPYARDHYVFDMAGRVIRHDVQGQGCSACTAGIGSFTYAYQTNPNPAGVGFNQWRSKTIETRPDSTQVVTYCNAHGQPMLSITRSGSGASVQQWGTFHRYDSNGLPVWEALPSAVSLPASESQIEQWPDLLHETSPGHYDSVRNDAGLINVTSYYPTTTAGETTPGGVKAFVSGHGVMRGDGAAVTPISSVSYVRHVVGTVTVVLPAAIAGYSLAGSQGAQVYSVAYVWVPGTTRLMQSAETAPVIDAAHHGTGATETITHAFDAIGRETWTRDADGFIRLAVHDAATGAVTRTIEDVDTSRSADFMGQSLPTGWQTPTGGGLHLVTTNEIDSLGRITKQISPRGVATFTVFDDRNRSVRIYPGWNPDTNSTTGPTEVYRLDASGLSSEVLTMAAAPSVSGGRPTGLEPIGAVRSLERTVNNIAGQVIAVDRYWNLSGLISSTSVSAGGDPVLGTEGANYYRTRYGYNNQGMVDRLVSPTGTITHYQYDPQRRLTAVSTGTDDSTSTGLKWTPATQSARANMTPVVTYEYDNGTIGDGALTKEVRFPGGSGLSIVTLRAYDWRDRLVATKVGAQSPEDSSTNRLLTYVDLDNLGNTLAAGQFDGDQVWVSDSNGDGVPDKPAASLLRTLSTNSYDARNRLIEGQAWYVDQTTGATDASRVLKTDLFYDRRGKVAMAVIPNAPATQYAHDGAGRLTSSYTLGNVPSAPWSTGGSIVLHQVDLTYDRAGNVIQTVSRDRFDDASSSLGGALGTPTSGVPARVSFTAAYYDYANRPIFSIDAGTNGGVPFVRFPNVNDYTKPTQRSSYGYDDAGHVSDVVDQRLVFTHRTYDALGRVASVALNATGQAPGTDHDVTTRYTYDGSDHVATVTAVQPQGLPSQTTRFVYGVTTPSSKIASNDLLGEINYPDPVTGQPSTAERMTFTVNALGDRLTAKDRNGTVHAYAFDSLGRPILDRIDAFGKGVDATLQKQAIAYDGGGRAALFTAYGQSTAGSTDVRVQKTFNSFGQLVREEQSHIGAINSATPAVNYVYSTPAGLNVSRLDSIRYPSTRQINYGYVPGIDATVNRPSFVSEGQIALEVFRYLGADTVVQRSLPQVGLTLSMASKTGTSGEAGDKYSGLDRFGRVVDQRWSTSTSTGADIDRYQYAYDDVGNPTIRANLLNDKLTETYGYDSLNQLVGYVRKDAIPAPSRVQTQSWQFDALGNWTTAWTGSTPQTRVTNAQNEITSVGATALTHDANGNLTTDEAGHKLVYDAWNRLHMVATVNGKPVAIYAYDALGRRVSEFLNASSPAETRHCYYSDRWQVIEERVQTTARSTTGRLNAQYVWSPVYVDALIERDRDTNGDAILDERVYALQDANWNVTAIVAGPGVAGQAVGNIINRFAYSPYGTTQVMTPSWTAASSTAIPWKHTFQGLAGNTFTGLYDARNRDYSPTLGRFIEPDPIGFQAGDNNFYRFVGNRPVGRNDPLGLYVDLAIEVVSIGTGAWSFVTNAWAGNLAAAGVVIDVGLAIVPGAPGGTGLALKAGREAAERVAREAAERAAREAAEQAARAAREAAEKAAKVGGKCAAPKELIPQHVTDVLKAIRHNNAASKGYKGGGSFANDGRGGGQLLPKLDSAGKPITYREFDVNPFHKGVTRGTDRIVTGSDGKAYFTNDHYSTFIEIP